MKVTNCDQLAEYLVREWDYVPAQAPETANKLLNLDPSIRSAFENWLESGDFPEEPVYSGHSPKSLNSLVHLKPPAIFLLLDWIWRDPVEANRAIKEELISRKQEFT